LCLMIMPGRSCVAGIDIAQNSPCTIAVKPAEDGQPKFRRHRG